MVRILLLWMILSVVPAQVLAQMFSQAWPEEEYSPISAVVDWNRDTIVMAGYEGLIALSTDAGRSWKENRPAGREWSIHHAVSNAHGVFLLAEPTIWNRFTLAPGQVSALLRFAPSTGNIDIVPFPLLPASDSANLATVQTYELAGDGAALFLLQASILHGTSLHRSLDGGRNWLAIPLPDSVRNSKDVYLASHDSTHIAIRLHSRIGGLSGFRLFTTTNAGLTWSTQTDLFVAGAQPRTGADRASFCWASAEKLYLFSTDGAMLRSDDGGNSWLHRGFPSFKSITQMKSLEDGRGYVLADGKLFRSDDGFSTFRELLPSRWMKYFLAIGQDTLIATADTDDVTLSYDGGVSWDDIRMNPLLVETIRMGNDDHGIALCKHIPSDRYRYYATDDGWKSMRHFEDEDRFGAPPCRIYPVTASVWYRIEGTIPESGPIISKSIDAGQSWSKVLDRDAIAGIPAGTLVRDASINDTNAIGFLADGQLVSTRDQGKTWQGAKLPVRSENIYSQLHLDGPSWLLVYPDQNPRVDTLWYSDGDWADWRPVLVAPDTSSGKYNFSFFRPFHADRSGQCLVFARYDRPGLRKFSEIYRTGDSGATWEVYPQAPGADGALFFPDGTSAAMNAAPSKYGSKAPGRQLFRSTDGWRTSSIEDTRYSSHETLVRGGNQSLYLHGIDHIMRNQTGGINDAIPDAPAPSAFGIRSLYPHPVRNGVPTRIDITHDGNLYHTVEITLLDLTGRRVSVISNAIADDQAPGVFWLPLGLSPGVYVLRVTDGHRVTVRPLLVR
ncbi:MAG: hypothetical protein KFF77_07360 [Bacteroidetes bacterium]|nr:hypothetical protein [Bacteroidota bacterium]